MVRKARTLLTISGQRGEIAPEYVVLIAVIVFAACAAIPVFSDGVADLAESQNYIKDRPTTSTTSTSSTVTTSVSTTSITTTVTTTLSTSSVSTSSGSCFTGDTLVLMSDGSFLRIDEVEVGDYVLARNEDDSVDSLELSPQRVSQVFVHHNEQVLRLEFGEEILDTTSVHPIFVVDYGWVPAGEINVGDLILSVDGSYYSVTGKEYLTELTTVYNLEVEGSHTYFVGDSSIWVHNKSVTTSSGGV